jgi:hypothetical protein
MSLTLKSPGERKREFHASAIEREEEDLCGVMAGSSGRSVGPVDELRVGEGVLPVRPRYGNRIVRGESSCCGPIYKLIQYDVLEEDPVAGSDGACLETTSLPVRRVGEGILTGGCVLCTKRHQFIDTILSAITDALWNING